jgi:hypothetical protein
MRTFPLLLASLLALPGLAGCLTPSAEVDPAAAAGDAASLRDLPAELVTPQLHPLALLGIGAGEPNVAVAPDGTQYVSAINDIYRSDDGGATWTLTMPNLDGGGDGDLAITPDGALHWLGLFGDVGPIPYQASSDRGETWSASVELSNETGSDREWIDAREDEPTVYAVWRDNDGDGIVAFRSSFDGGKTWNERVTVSDDAIGGPLAHGPVPGQVYQAQATLESTIGAGDASIRFARSADHGATWELVPVLTPRQGAQVGLIGFPFSIFPVVSVDDAGTLYMVYAVDQGLVEGAPKPAARFGVYLVVSTDEGTTWSAPRLLSSPDHAAIMPWVAAGAKGRIAVAWYENTAGMPHDNLPDAWNVHLLEMLDADTDAPQLAQVQLNDLPVHIGSICTSGVGCYLSGGDRSLLDFLEVAISPTTGHPVVAFSATNFPHQGTVGIVGSTAGVEPLSGVSILVRAVSGGTPLR